MVALILYLAEIEWRFSHDRQGSIVFTLLLVYAFINGIRGTFAYQRFSKGGDDAAT